MRTPFRLKEEEDALAARRGPSRLGILDSRGASTHCLSRPLIPRKGCQHLEVLVRIVVKGLPSRETVVPTLKLSPPAHRNATFELCSSSRTQHPHVRGRGALGRQRAYLWSHGPGHPTGIGKLAGQMKWWVTNEPPTSAPLVVKPVNGEESGRFSGSGRKLPYSGPSQLPPLSC